MKLWKCLLRLAAAIFAIAGAVLLVMAYWEKISSFVQKLWLSCTQWCRDLCGSCHLFRRAEIEKEFADYADVD